jgi:hypothetical protein
VNNGITTITQNNVQGQNQGFGTASFFKGTSTTSALVKVYAPLTNTQWTFTCSCPTAATRLDPAALQADLKLHTNITSDAAR